VRDGQTVVFTSSDLKRGEELVVGVRFPHGVITAAKSNWQVLIDSADEYYEKALEHARARQFSEALADMNEAINSCQTMFHAIM